MADTRERILDTTAELFRRYGYGGTSLKQVLEAARAPFGSLYHHFPGGKEQLGAETVHRSGRMYLELFELVADAAPDVVTAVEEFFAGAAETLRRTDYADACPIATVALEVASANETLRQATGEVFTSWVDALAKRFAAAGLHSHAARDQAIGIIAALEGAFLLARAMRSTEPLHVAGTQAVHALRALTIEA